MYGKRRCGPAQKAYDWVTCSEAYWYDGEVTFTFENNTSDNIKEYSWITQLIFSHGKTDSSKTYKMNLKINVPVDCRISLGGKLVSLHAGDNLVTVGFKPDKDPAKNLFKIQFAISGEPFTIKEGTVKVSIEGNILETDVKALQIPSFSFDDEIKVITIDDTKNNEYDVSYILGFFANETDAAPQGTAVVKNGEAVDVSTVLTGSYYLKLMAASTGLPYESSGWSAVGGTIGVKNNRVDIENKGQSDAAKTPDTWFYWRPTSNMGMPETTVNEAYLQYHDDDSVSVHVDFTSPGYYQPLKLFCMRSDVKVGDLYRLTFNFNSPMDGKITVNGQVVDIKEGDNTVSVVRVQPATNGQNPCTITIQFGAQEGIAEIVLTGVCVISNITIEEAQAKSLAQITSFTYDAATQAVTIVDPNDYTNEFPNAGVTYELGYFNGESLIKSKIVASGDGFEHPNLAPGTYTLKLRIVSGTALYVGPDWFTPETPISVTIENPDYREDIPAGNTAGAAKNPGNWQYYKDSSDISEAYIDANGVIHLLYTATKPTNEPLKLFFMDGSMSKDDVYTLSFKINTKKGGNYNRKRSEPSACRGRQRNFGNPQASRPRR